MKFAIIQERKSPPDRRVVLDPKSCQKLLSTFPSAQLIIESSPIRAFTDMDYSSVGLDIVSDVSSAEVLIGVKEVPIEALIPNKSYFFFSHTIKKQPYNRNLLQAILDKNITLYDHETLVNKFHHRLIGFGYYAGVVGAYNGFRALGLKLNSFKLPKANTLVDRLALNKQLDQINIPSVKIILTGTGRVGQGAKEILDHLNIKQVSVNQFLNDKFEEAVYVQLDVLDYCERHDGMSIGKKDFFESPKAYKSIFDRFTKIADFFIAGHYYGKDAPVFFTREQAKASSFNLKVVADISCDIDGPVACTIRPSTIDQPIYGYDPETESEVDFKNTSAIAVMAVDNLPCELPKDASEGFGNSFVENILPAFFNNDHGGVLNRAKMTENGKLTSSFSYLQDYVDGK
ncbi:NAD(P)-dependent oxidoreductase [Flavobacteriaceae bacterium]|jgi:alanine dehydrogenase|nr:NAD(P)-dependent oxidoreductase [Flavobacteriaceae bacterium]MDC0462605.1 NAD(P)-dependent oxidoreductase [Flavobacteriaceae bacterium]|tara:strand:- start:118 stop:1320 length:1203 start_codon:yes stop_codon:yes gene_type:complete